MRLPEIHGVIRRRVLVNFRVDPEIIQKQIPKCFRPKLDNGSAIAGICLIRLEQIRPKFFPTVFGLSSENAAHRIAVLWNDKHGEVQEGVYVPRRDTNSNLNILAGGRLFPGEYHKATFQVSDSSERIDFQMKSEDSEVSVRLRSKVSKDLPASSKFTSLKHASDFFEPGSLGYSATTNDQRMDGMILKTKTWQVTPLDVEDVFSSYFSDEKAFPKNSVHFDCALLMRNIEHSWRSAPDLAV